MIWLGILAGLPAPRLAVGMGPALAGALHTIWTGGGCARCKIAIQSNNVEVDDRGYIYVADRVNTGLHILELTGEARSVANFK